MGLHGGNIREAIHKYHLKEKGFIDFSANINPLGFPQDLKRIVSDNLDTIQYYPDPDCKIIKKALSQYLRTPEDNLLIGNGSIELIFLIAFALKPKRALIPVPSFSEYERAVSLAGGKCLFLKAAEENNFQINMDRIVNNRNRVDLIFLSNPNNPTGFLFDKQEIMFLVKECEKRSIFLVIDEVFMDFVVEKDDVSMLKFAWKNKHILVLQSLTKFFALPGLRFGYLTGEKNLIERISCYQPPWAVNSLAQLAGPMVLKEASFISKSRQYLFEQREELFEEVKKIKYLKPYPPSANFIFCKLSTRRINSGQLCDYCGRKGILIRDCSNFRGLDNSFIRIAVRKKEENRKLVKVLREFL